MSSRFSGVSCTSQSITSESMQASAITVANTTYVAQMVVFATVIADACMISNVIDCDVHETPLTFDDGKGATALRDGGAGAHRGRAHAPAYERPRGSM